MQFRYVSRVIGSLGHCPLLALLMNRDRRRCAAFQYAQGGHAVQLARQRRQERQGMNLANNGAPRAQIQGRGDRHECGDQQHDESLPAHVEPLSVVSDEAARRRRRVDKMTTPAIATTSGAMAMLMTFNREPNRLMSTSRPRCVSRNSLRTRVFSAVKRFSSASCSGESMMSSDRFACFGIRA